MHTTRPLLAAALLLSAPVTAQGRPTDPVAVGTVITTFLVDSGVRTRGLPWTVAGTLPIRWASPRPIPATGEWYARQGITLLHEGAFRGTLGDSVTLPMTITLTGNATGLSGMSISPNSLQVTHPDGSGYWVTREMIEAALQHDGLEFKPLKCSRETEGASYGNLVDAVKAPGKTASGLWWSWDAPMQELRVTLTLLYRRADMAQVECVGS
jgi:hypothetical protein